MPLASVMAKGSPASRTPLLLRSANTVTLPIPSPASATPLLFLSWKIVLPMLPAKVVTEAVLVTGAIELPLASTA